MKVLSRKDAELITELTKSGISATEIAKHAIPTLSRDADKDEYTKYVYEKTREALEKTYRRKEDNNMVECKWWAVICETEIGKIFKLAETIDEAKEKAMDISLNGYYKATIYHYDKENNEYLEYCEI